MSYIDLVSTIKENGICAIVRGSSADSMCHIAEALLKGGVKLIEVTFNTSDAADSIARLSGEFGHDMIVGAGTVLDAATARVAISAGASFVLSPALDIDTMRMCQRYGVLPVPGVATPTEIVRAWENGAQLVKIFPAGSFGMGYFKQVKGPLPHINMMAVGGVDLDNIQGFLKAGACSAGIGSNLVSKKLVDEGRFNEITSRAAAFIQAFRDAGNI